MELTEEQKKQADEYMLDIKATLCSNVFLALGFILSAMYIKVFADVLNSFTMPEMQLLAIFVFSYSVIRIMASLVSYDLNLEYKHR